MGAYEQLSAEDRGRIDQLLAETRANGGLAPLDLDQWWADQDVAWKDPFGSDIPQLPFGAVLSYECAFPELGMEVDHWRWQEDEAFRLDVAKRFNDKAEGIVGRRILNEQPRDPAKAAPERKHLNDLFEAQNTWEGGPAGSWWLHQSADSVEELKALLDRVEKRLEKIDEFIIPEDYQEGVRRMRQAGANPPAYRWQRGPCTFATSIFGAENMLLLGYDDMGLLRHFSDVLARSIIAIAEAVDRANGTSIADEPRGWNWADDNSCLFNPELYEQFAMPIHRAVMGRFAPRKEDRRFQHSDSEMGHLLPQLSELDLTGTNFGPTLSVAEIREHLPRAVIRGQLAPFTYSRNDEPNMLGELLRDWHQAKEKRGLVFDAAGSINYGSRLTGMRLLMAGIQRWCRF